MFYNQGGLNMDKNEAFELIVGVISQVNGFNLDQAKQLEEAIQVLAKTINYQANTNVQDLETPQIKKK